ncbi:MAG: S-layer homology domain-containing protein [Faecousia sp.]
MKKRIIGLILMIAILLTMLPARALAAQREEAAKTISVVGLALEYGKTAADYTDYAAYVDGTRYEIASVRIGDVNLSDYPGIFRGGSYPITVLIPGLTKNAYDSDTVITMDGQRSEARYVSNKGVEITCTREIVSLMYGTVTVTGVNIEIGKRPGDYTARCVVDGEEHAVTDLRFNGVSASQCKDVFIPGTYEIGILVNDLDPEYIDDNTVVSVDGVTDPGEISFRKPEEGGLLICRTVTLTGSLNAADVSGYTVPYAGCTVGEANGALHTPAGAQYSVSRVTWYDLTTNGELTAASVFQEGHEYEAVIRLTPAENYSFLSNFQGTVNQRRDLVEKSLLSGKDAVLYLKSFVAKPLMVISRVQLTGYREPVEGQTAAGNMEGLTIPGDQHFHPSDASVYWYNETDKTSMKPGDTFRGDKQYCLVIQLFAEGEYSFAEDVDVTLDGTGDKIRTVSCDGSICALATYAVFPEPEGTVIFGCGFESDGEMSGWTFVDGDGDGFGWISGDRAAIDRAYAVLPDVHEGSGILASFSYHNRLSRALTPDNWAITPAIELPVEKATLTLLVMSQDALFPEPFAVYVGKTPDPGKMTKISGETDPIAPCVLRDDGTVAYSRMNFDLSAYLGQTVYIAIRHWNSTNNYMLGVDSLAVCGKGRRKSESCGGDAAVCPSVGYKDVPAYPFWSHDPIDWAVENGITKGTSAVTFSPDSPCTRAQVVTFLWRAAGCPAPAGTAAPYVDLKEGEYYCDAVLWAVENGITKGTDPTHFSPGEPCTRGQVVTFLWRFANCPQASASNPYQDVKPEEYYYTGVLWAVENGITNGTGPATFAPEATCTRAQVVTFLYRSMTK